ncbi:unnamed protein product [Mesocestoides corti]|nr:unnamed protein product [Mesocestoides corti]
MMLIPPAVTPSVNSVPSDYRTDQKATDKPPFPPKRLFNHPPDSQAVAEPKSSRLGSTHKSASEGFATPPSSAFLGAFKAPLSVPPSVNFGLNACLSPEPTSVQNNRPYHYGSPEISEIDDVS